jgi:hypothetical protein
VLPSVQQLLTAHTVMDASDAVFPTLDAALEWCEEQLLQVCHHPPPPHKLGVHAALLTSCGHLCAAVGGCAVCLLRE